MIEPNEMIERWVNVERVLDAMPAHERQNHWNMGTWGELDKCGTIACAAGHCGLDPWFRERGFKLDFLGKEARISSVEPFFGLEGSSRIFLNTTHRPVETVIDEVRAYILEQRKIAALTAKLPKIGETWSEQGGVYAGARLGRNGARDYLLIVGPEFDGRPDWDEAMAWAASLEIDGHKDFTLPDRSELPALFDRVRSLFQPNAYWSCEQHASNSSDAWGQNFSYGSQNYWDKSNELRARAVRRLPL